MGYIGPGDGNKLRTYAMIKTDISMEMYLSCSNLNWGKRRILAKFRTSNHKLAIETGRYCKPKTPVNERTCIKCNCDLVENELHFLTKCNFYNGLRDKYLSSLKNTNFQDNEAFISVMTTHDEMELYNLACFLQEAFSLRDPEPQPQ